MSTVKNSVIITGACGGIGKSLCDVFLKNNYYVIAIDKSKENCANNVFIQTDLTIMLDKKEEKNHLSKSLRKIFKSYPLIGIVNNAAIQILSSIDEIRIKDFRKTFDTNLTVPLLLSKMFVDELEKEKGAIVNVGSIHAKLTKPGFISYATSKAALVGLTRALAVDLGPKGVRVNAIQPAATYTQMLADGFIDSQSSIRKLKKFHPLKRIAKPKEIALFAEFLINRRCSFITGVSIDIDGGIGGRLHDPD